MKIIWEVLTLHLHMSQLNVRKTYVDNSVSSLVDAAPETLNTLNELAAAIGDDQNFSTISTSLGEKLVKSSNLSDLTNVATAEQIYQSDVAGTDNSTNVTLCRS